MIDEKNSLILGGGILMSGVSLSKLIKYGGMRISSLIFNLCVGLMRPELTHI